MSNSLPRRIRTRRTTGRRRTTRCSATGARCFRWSGAATSVLSAATTTSAKSATMTTRTQRTDTSSTACAALGVGAASSLAALSPLQPPPLLPSALSYGTRRWCSSASSPLSPRRSTPGEGCHVRSSLSSSRSKRQAQSPRPQHLLPTAPRRATPAHPLLSPREEVSRSSSPSRPLQGTGGSRARTRRLGGLSAWSAARAFSRRATACLSAPRPKAAPRQGATSCGTTRTR
mmetsp:Transcript_12945/g.20340  ORF Transcript_12945/g.20340 Transcript_12945/m.20340 type:complete len:231 (-) Transcript_12945:2238-2930(-)